MTPSSAIELDPIKTLSKAAIAKAAHHRELAREYRQAGQWSKALLESQQVLQIDSEDIEAYAMQGEALSGLERWKEAIASYQEALDVQPAALVLNHKIAVILSRLNRLPEADEQYAHIFSKRPNFEVQNLNNFSIQAQAGDYFFRQRQWQRAVRAYRNAIALKPEACWESINLGRSLYQLGKDDDAIALFQTVIEAGHSNGWAIYYLGEILFEQGQLSEALALSQQAQRLMPYDFEARSLAEKVYAATAPSDAASVAARLGKRQPDQVVSTRVLLGWKDSYALGEQLRADNNVGGALQAFYLSLIKNPQHSETYRVLGDIQLELGNWPVAIAAYQQASRLNPDPLLSQQIASIAVYLDVPEASTDWQEVYEAGKQLQIKGDLEAALSAYMLSLIANPQIAITYHDIGDVQLNRGDWGSAIAAYEQAIALNPDYLWSIYNLGIAYRNIGIWQNTVHLYQQAIALNPGVNLLTRGLEETLKGWYDERMAKGDRILHSQKDEALALYQQAVESYADNTYLPPFEAAREPGDPLSVLLIVDAHLTQCLRYRVEQKIEQLEQAGLETTYYRWEDAATAQNQMAFFDVVIFYRTPAFPDVIQAIKYAKAVKKIVFYEIDDLIFDAALFPDPIESYGGQITQEQHDELVKGTLLFQEAMKLCDLAIASTPPLLKRMEAFVGEGSVYLHRNALDSKLLDAIEIDTPKVERDYVSIFYGSGTKAHNQDFDELIAPALIKLFEQHPQVRLTLMGYLTLPKRLKPYRDRIDRVDLVRDISIYYEFLRQADIAIAVLHPTVVNNCKSELKWFEAASFKVPAVVSNTDVYLEAINQGQDGFIAATSEDWFTYLDRLVVDKALREQIGTAAYDRVTQDYSLAAMAENIQRILTAGADRNRALEPAIPEAGPRKKVLVVNVFYPPQSIGGATRIVKDNVDVLCDRYAADYDVSVFTTDNDNPEPYKIVEYSHQGVPVTKVSSPMMVGMDWQYKNPEMYDIFTAYLTVNQPDLIHFHCIQRLTASVLEAAADLEIPYVVTAHDAWWISDHQFLVNEDGEECDYQQNDPVVAARDTHNVTESIQRKLYLREQLNKASKVLAVSENFTALYQKNGFPQTQANRNGIQPQPPMPRQPSSSGRVRLAHIGGMAAHKGYFLFKSAVENADLTNTEIVVINHAQVPGTTTYDTWGTTPVTFLPKFDQNSIGELYSMVDVLVAPSMWPESFGLVTREAAAAGVWVIASDKGAIGEDVIPGENGHVISVESETPLLETLREIDTNSVFYTARNGSIKSVRTTAAQVDELSAFYQQILSASV